MHALPLGLTFYKGDKESTAGGQLKATSFSVENRETADGLREMEGVEFINVQVGNCKAFSSAAGQGLSVMESTPLDEKAIKEVNDLFSAIPIK